MKMKKIISVFFLLMTPSLAFGADLPNRRVVSAPSVAAVAPSWDGFSFGIGVGASRVASANNYQHTHFGACSNNDYGSNGLCTGSVDYSYLFQASHTNALGSVRLGYNWQSQNYVYGLVGSANLSKKQIFSTSQVLSSTWGDTLSVDETLGNSASVQALLGYSAGSFLPYATAGLAVGKVSSRVYQLAISYTGVEFKKSQNKIGYVLGGGLKYQVTSNWILGAEYLHTSFSSLKLSGDHSSCCGGIMYPDTTANVKLKTDVVSLLAEYKF
ncbi:MAG: hypothetical protein RIQ68_1734 [Pseudomonadota bacterium]